MFFLIMVLLILLICRAIWMILPFVVRMILTILLDIGVVRLAVRGILNLKNSDSGMIGKIFKFILELAIAIPFTLDLIFWVKWIFLIFFT